MQKTRHALPISKKRRRARSPLSDALADIWLIDRRHEMGQHFRTWIDVIIVDMGPQIGLPYHGRSYIDILPAHYVHEPDHLEAHSSSTWQKYGVAPGSGTDATMEMVKTCFVAWCLIWCWKLTMTPELDPCVLVQLNQSMKRFSTSGRGSCVGGRTLSTTSFSGNKFWKYLIWKYG